jgi:peptide-methionine (R)-S-oxide reductase
MRRLLLFLLAPAACSPESAPKPVEMAAPDSGRVSDADWRKRLTPEQYYVCREKGTERPWSGKYNDFKGKGTFDCVACGNPLFKSATKFESGTGWPSFFDPADPKSVKKIPDRSHGMLRVEVVCAKCDSHLGHVFDDGPPPTGLRYCMNSVALRFVEEK